jgi:CDP-diacylglycerol--glycerol-3-phosphate 3-phosphatidyltransferase
MTTASRITLVRVILIPVFMVCLLLAIGSDKLDSLRYVAVGVFVVASLSDFLDGYIARHYNQVTDFGKFLDPLADKLLVTSALIIFVQWGRMPAWAVIIVVAREFAVTGLRLVAVQGGRVIAAGWSGKIKTASTLVGLIAMMLFTGSPVFDWIVTILIVLTTVYSGVEYFVKNWDCLNLKKTA